MDVGCARGESLPPPACVLLPTAPESRCLGGCAACLPQAGEGALRPLTLSPRLWSVDLASTFFSSWFRRHPQRAEGS